MWPLEAHAIRQGVTPSKVTPTSTAAAIDKNVRSEVKQQIQKSLDQQVTHVDRLETIPSPYMWQVLRVLLCRLLETLKHEITTLQTDLGAITCSYNSPQDEIDVASIVQAQADAITRMTYVYSHVHAQMESLRATYTRHVHAHASQDVLQQARVKEVKRLQKLDLVDKATLLKATPSSSASGTSTTGAPTTAFGTTPAPAPGGGSFGSTTTPAPATGGLFGSSPAPAPGTGGGLFGSTTVWR